MKLREFLTLCERNFSVTVYELNSKQIIGHVVDGELIDGPKEILERQVFSIGKDYIDLKDLRVLIN